MLFLFVCIYHQRTVTKNLGFEISILWVLVTADKLLHNSVAYNNNYLSLLWFCGPRIPTAYKGDGLSLSQSVSNLSWRTWKMKIKIFWELFHSPGGSAGTISHSSDTSLSSSWGFLRMWWVSGVSMAQDTEDHGTTMSFRKPYQEQKMDG